MTLQHDVGILSLLIAFSFFLAGYLIGRAKEITTVRANQNSRKNIVITKLKQELQQVQDISTTLATLSFSLAGHLISQAKEIITMPANQNQGKEIAITELKQELQQVQDISTALEKILNHLVQKEIVQSAILASEQGLLVAGNDEHSDALAVIAAMFDDLVKRLPNTPLLMKEVKRIDIVGEDNTIITAQYFQMASGQLILVSFTTAPAPDWTPLQQLIELINETLTTIGKLT